MNEKLVGIFMVAVAGYFLVRGEVQSIIDSAAVKAGAAAGQNAGRELGGSITSGLGSIARSFIDGGAGQP